MLARSARRRRHSGDRSASSLASTKSQQGWRQHGLHRPVLVGRSRPLSTRSTTHEPPDHNPRILPGPPPRHRAYALHSPWHALAVAPRSTQVHTPLSVVVLRRRVSHPRAELDTFGLGTPDMPEGPSRLHGPTPPPYRLRRGLIPRLVAADEVVGSSPAAPTSVM